VCTAARCRGRGVAAALLGAALRIVGGAECVLDSQVAAQGLYARYGFAPEGDEFDEDGIPHIAMRRKPPP
jgi:ElaA protein